MKQTTNAVLLSLSILFFFSSCKKEALPSATEAKLIFQFKFDSTQARLNNVGQAAGLPAGNAGQSPVFNKMSAHYIELSPAVFTTLGGGAVLYKAEETTTGGSKAIDFERSIAVGNNQTFYEMPLKNIAPGEYEWLRLSLAYQNYNVKFYIDTTISGITIKQEYTGTVASFIGYNTYIKNYAISSQPVTVNANKKQGYWGFETAISYAGVSYPYTTSGQAPDGATTVVNPLFATSPIPQGSCVVTAAFAPGKLKITGNETKDIIVQVNLSTNKSFEWTEVVADGRWEPGKGEQVVDMGIRGMIPIIK